MAYNDLAPDDQRRFDAAVQSLRREGFLWREEERDRRAYNFVARQQELIAAQVQAGGWELRHHDQLQAFQLVDAKGARRRQFDSDTILWLLILRLLYAETQPVFTPYPVVAVKDIAARATDLSAVPGGLDEALPAFHSLKLIRPAGSSTLRPADPDQLVELLPTLEFAIPAEAIEHTYRQISPPKREARKDAMHNTP